MKISDIQKWEKGFIKKKNLPSGEEDQTRIGLSKLKEEVAELAEAVSEGRWNEVQAEISDVIIFACKIANIAEGFHGAEKLEKVLKRKIEYSEIRKLDASRGLNKLDKPENEEFK